MIPFQYYLLENEKISGCNHYEEWVRFFKNVENRRIAIDIIKDHTISTVFLGFDHGVDPESPVLFETMVFENSDQSGREVYCERYVSLDEAKKGHENVKKRFLRDDR